jgi:hypothetical protein
MADLPFIAIGNNELGPPLLDTIKCPICGTDHVIENSGPSTVLHADGTESVGESGTLQFYRCGEGVYLAGIEGRQV